MTATHRPRSVALFLATIVATGSLAIADEAGAPFPTAVPWTWTVQEDFLVTDGQLEGFSQKLGGQIVGIRNTRFEVAPGQTVQINALNAATEDDAKAVFAKMAESKPEEFLVRHGNVVFEFVGNDRVLSQMRKAAEMLKAAPPKQP